MKSVSDFRHLVARLERECDVAPTTYRTKLVLLAALGYFYVIALLGLSLGGVLFGALLLADGSLYVGGQVILVCGVIMVLVCRALWVRMPLPDGLRLKPDDAPELFRLIEKVRKRENGPEIHEIVINAEFNAAMVQTPRFGLFGGYRNSLLLGLPLMQALSPKEFAAVLAHEYGHLSAAHGKLGAWIYRIRAVWQQMIEAFDDGASILDRTIHRFFRWYVPYFNAYSFVLARQQEYEADRASARLVGAHVAAEALIASDLKGRFVAEQFWPGLYAQADRFPKPSTLPHATMRAALKRGATTKEYEGWLKESLTRLTAYDDTHPSLRDRLDALGEQATPPGPLEQSAAQRLLGPNHVAIIEALDKEWLAEVSASWSARHRTVKEAEELVAQHPTGRPRFDPELYGKLGLAFETLGRDEEALPLLREAALHSRGTAETAMAAARILLKEGNEDAIRYLELAMDRDGDLIQEATWRAWQFFEDRGDAEKSAYWRERLNRISS